MLKRHMNEMAARLEQVAELGCAVIRKQELLRWHGKEKLMKSVWRSLYDEWVDIEPDAPLLIGDGDGSVTLILGRGLEVTEDSWFEDIRQWAGVEIDDV